MKQRIDSQWHDGIDIHVRVKQFTRAAKLIGRESFKDYSGILAAASERDAVDEWLDSAVAAKEAKKIA